MTSGFSPPIGLDGLQILQVFPDCDVAVLKVDFNMNSSKAWLSGKKAFPYITPSVKTLPIGQAAFSFGYPLSDTSILPTPPSFGAVISTTSLRPRLTSCIVSSHLVETQMVMFANSPKKYVFDRAFNPGNSGGPIIDADTGLVHAVCHAYQRMQVNQPNGNAPLFVPSNYGIGSSLDYPPLAQFLKTQNVFFK